MVRVLYSYDEVIAKSDGTSLKNHILDSVNVLDILLDLNMDLLKNRAKLLGMNLDLFLSNLRKATFFHDFGKVSDKWQLKARENPVSLPPHAVYSGFFLSFTKNPNNLIPFLALTSHHSLLTENSFGNNLNRNIKFNEDYLLNLANSNNFYLEKFDSLDIYLKSMQNFIIRSQSNDFRNIKKISEKIIIDVLFKAEYCLSLSYLTISDGLASKFEGDAENINKSEIVNRYPSSEYILKTIGDFTKGRTLTSIQESIVSIKNSNDINELIKPVLMEAPCGEGKTLASLLYAEKLFKNNLINKVIFALPTQITSNNMFNEFEEEYNIPREWIGIYHSEVFNFLMSIYENDKDNELTDFNPNFEKYQNLIYSKPFNISTIDHLLLSLVNGFKYAPRAFGNLCNSLVIIDELHYYDNHTLNLIEVLCEILRLLKIPHIIMSATIPSNIKDKFNNDDYLKIQSSGSDFKSIEKNPFEFSFHDSLIYEDDFISKEFLEIVDENIDKNLGIIVNTVAMSQKLFEDIKKQYPEKQVLLYNSRFMKIDKPVKERLLKYFSNVVFDKIKDIERKELLKFNFNPDEKFIFIGTQVAEISLNMSFDTIISQLAPFDSLIQRGGRLHRKMTFNNSKECNCLQCQKLDENHKYFLHVFETGEYCYPYFTKKDKEKKNYKMNIINNTKKVLLKPLKFTFKNSIKMMNEVYNFDNLDSLDKDNENKKIDFKKIIIEDLIFGKRPSFSEEKGGQLRIQTRDINMPSTLVLPSAFHYNDIYISAEDFINNIYENHNYEGNLTSEGLSEIMNHMVNISYEFYVKNKKIEVYGSDDNKFKIIDLDYTFERGLFKDETIMF